MLNQREIGRAVDMQNRSYRLLRWLAKAVDEGFIQFETAHRYTSLAVAAEAWIGDHYLNIPPQARVPQQDLHDFCAFFSTYLENSFDLISNPGMQRYSPAAHCFCPMCSWLVNAPHLKTKKVSSSDKRRSRSMNVATVRDLAAEHKVDLTEPEVDAIVDDPGLRRIVFLVTYGHELLRRMQGIATGPAVLVLWRGFAWSDTGSPRKNFRLTADAILDGERQLSDAVLAYGKNGTP
jgi:hypothetical protein